jgi:membrane-associated phospholipid phosphatase
MESRPGSSTRAAAAAHADADAIIGVPRTATKADPAARASARLVAAYLLLTALLLLPGGLDGMRVSVLAFHAVVAAVLLATAGGRVAARPPVRVILDWAPLLLIPVLYGELPLLMEGIPGPVRYHDAAVAGLESRLFGGQPAFEWAGAWPVPLVSELLHASYLSYYALIYVPPLLLYRAIPRGVPDRSGSPERGAFHQTVFALALCFLSCFLVFIVLPVQGPRYLGEPAGVPDGPVRALVLTVLESGSSRGAAFPSSHVAVAVTQALVAIRHRGFAGAWVLALTCGLSAGAVYGGFHYGVDVLAGAAVGALVVPLASRIARRQTSPPHLPRNETGVRHA